MSQGSSIAAQQQLLDAFSTEHLHADLKGRSVRGGLLTLTSQGAQFLMQSISTVVLARLLVPADFGLVAMVTAITGLGQAFADLGLSEATIQRQEISHNQVSTLFWINVAIGLTLMLVTAGLAPVLAWFYREPRLKDITFLLSLTFLIGGLRVQHDALLKRQMRFSSLAIRDVASYVLAVPVAITMAWRGAGYWALVALPLTLNLTQMVAFLVDGQMDTGPAPTRRQSSFPGRLWRQCCSLLPHIQCESQCRQRPDRLVLGSRSAGAVFEGLQSAYATLCASSVPRPAASLSPPSAESRTIRSALRDTICAPLT